MNSERIITPNFYAPGRGYFNRVVLPSLQTTQKLSHPIVQKYIIAGKHIHIYMYGAGALHVFPPAFSHQKKSHVENPAEQR